MKIINQLRIRSYQWRYEGKSLDLLSSDGAERNSHRMDTVKKGLTKYFANFTGKYLC